MLNVLQRGGFHSSLSLCPNPHIPPANVPPQMQQPHPGKQLKSAAHTKESFHLDISPCLSKLRKLDGLLKLGHCLLSLDHSLHSFLCPIFTSHTCALSHIQHTPLHISIPPEATSGIGGESVAYIYTKPPCTARLGGTHTAGEAWGGAGSESPPEGKMDRAIFLA